MFFSHQMAEIKENDIVLATVSEGKISVLLIHILPHSEHINCSDLFGKGSLAV